MDKLTKLVFERTMNGSIDVETSTDILHLLKTEKRNEHKDIAIIGIAFKFPNADNLEQLWDILSEGKDCITQFPKSRYQDAYDMLKSTTLSWDKVEFSKGGYLDNIDQFDHNFFHISLNEAKLMDPNQKIFLETVWEALEDAGYGGEKIIGSNTGTYLGYGNSMDCTYSQFIIGKDPAVTAASMPGNVTPIIASRISYILDLKGPSMVVDTACSSSFTALHLACKALENGECDMALSGGINLSLIPIWKKIIQVGIESSNGDVKAFDDSSDGVSWSEGAAAILLKPLETAIADKDNIYAVIKGSAINQDGNSVGITAPNGKAQEEVLIKAWENAKVEAESITYIEAHGTGTKLGDPIEVEAITNAFRRFTKKKQFCGIGSVKSNLGHLNCASGMSALLKAIVSLKHKQIPATIHFKMPNRHIGFTESPVFVNDVLRYWESEESKRRCGISSFGFSGTNCHLVLEETPIDMDEAKKTIEGTQLLKLSAKTKEALYALVKSYQMFLIKNPETPLEQICYTANTGRGDYEYRLVILANDVAELRKNLEIIEYTEFEDILDSNIFYGIHKIVNESKIQREAYELTEYEKINKSSDANKLLDNIANVDGTFDVKKLEELSHFYVLGADIYWEWLFKGKKINKICLPTYPFERVRCWLDFEELKEDSILQQESEENKALHVLVNKGMISSYDGDIYRTEISEKNNWFLSDHVIGDLCVAPGTTWMEALRFVGERYFGKGNLKIEVLFIQPVKVLHDENKEVQIVVKRKDDCYSFKIVGKDSQNPEQWILHAQGYLHQIENKNLDGLKANINELKSRLNTKLEIRPDDYQGGPIKFGPRWFNLKEVYVKDNEFLGYMELQDAFVDDLQDFKIHPAILDTATSFCNTDGFYLPMEYKSFEIYDYMPKNVYSYVKKKDNNNHLETQTFDVLLLDEYGNVFAKADGFVMKKVRETKAKAFTKNSNRYFKQKWVPDPNQMNFQPLKKGDILIFHDEKDYGKELVQRFKQLGRRVIEVKKAQKFEKIHEEYYTVGNSEDAYIKLFEELKQYSIRYMFHLFTIQDTSEMNDFEKFEESQKRGIYSLFYTIRSMVLNKYKEDIDLILVSENVYNITGTQKSGYFNSGFLGLGKVISAEYDFIKCQGIDIDAQTTCEDILNEIRNRGQYYQIAYRDHVRYVEEFMHMDLNECEPTAFEVREKGTYVITGGTGGIGLEVSRWLARQSKVNLVLINRSQFPIIDQWDELLENNDSKYSKAINVIKEVQGLGSRVVCFTGNIADKEDTERILNDTRKMFGKIHGIFHAAGVPGNKFLYNKSEDEFKEVISPKIEGSWLLNDLTKQDELDFLVLFSSINSLLGVPGQGDYTAANSFMDAFAEADMNYGNRVISINWPAWKETGMSVRFGVNNVKGNFKSIDNKTALHSLEEIMNRNVNRVLVGELNEGSEIEKGFGRLPFKIEDSIQKLFKTDTQYKSLKKTKEKVIVRGNEGSKNCETEQKLAEVWGKVLGVKEIDIYDSFSSLGGDSIQAVNLLKELEQIYPKIFDITDIFTYSTIKKMSDHINKQTKDDINRNPADVADTENKDTEEDLDSLLVKLVNGDLSADEADKLME